METDFHELTDDELRLILARHPIDIQARLKAQNEIDRRARVKHQWSRSEKWTAFTVVATVVLGVLTTAASMMFPELRRALGLDRSNPQSAKVAISATPPSAASVDALKGIWADSDIATNGGQEFFEFLPGGTVSIRLNSVTGDPITMADWSWFLTGDNLHVVIRVTKPNALAYVYEGKLEGEIVEGLWWKSGSSEKYPWHLQRAAVIQPPLKQSRSLQKPAVKAIPGIWADPNLEINGKPIFVQFLPEGRVQLRDVLSGVPAKPSSVNWYRTGDAIHLIWEKDGAVAEKWDLVLKGNVMEGTLTVLSSGQSSSLRLVRVDLQ